MSVVVRIVVVAVLVSIALPAQAQNSGPDGGLFGCYLIGVFDLRAGNRTVFRIVNPTSANTLVWVAFCDDQGQVVKCAKRDLASNSVVEIDVLVELPLDSKPAFPRFGVAKVLSASGNGRPQPGIVGYQLQQQTSREAVNSSESLMALVPTWVLEASNGAELRLILSGCAR